MEKKKRKGYGVSGMEQCKLSKIVKHAVSGLPWWLSR